jgi:outer membrane protein TolC
MQNPNYEIADRTVSIAGYQIRLAKSTWLATMSAQGNVNEFTIEPKTAGTTPEGTPIPNYYPKYNFGINIPFDILTRIPSNVKIARQNYYIAEAQKNERYRQIREEVLTVYEDYLLAKQTLEFQIQVTQDEYTLYKRAEKDYSDGIIKLEDFDKSYKSWTGEQIKKLTFQRNLNVIKLSLERITGVKIDDILQQTKQ